MSALVAKVENVFDSFGAMRGGPEAYVKRSLIGGALGYVVIEAWRPSWAYYDDGTPRPWAVTQWTSDLEARTGQQHGTYFPWFFVPIATGAFCATFI